MDDWKDYLEKFEKRIEKRFDKLETKSEKLDERVDLLEKDTAESRIYVKQIFTILDELKMTFQAGLTKKDLFDFFQGDRANDQKDRQDERQTNEKTLDKWQKTIITIIGATIAVIIGYIFGGQS